MDREYRIPVRLNRDVVVRVLAGSPGLAEMYARRGDWADIVFDVGDRMAEVEIVGEAIEGKVVSDA